MELSIGRLLAAFGILWTLATGATPAIAQEEVPPSEEAGDQPTSEEEAVSSRTSDPREDIYARLATTESLTEKSRIAQRNRIPCWRVLNAGVSLSPAEKRSFRRLMNGTQSRCTPAGEAIRSTAAFSGPRTGFFQLSVQFLPSFSLGIPLGAKDTSSPAYQSLEGIGAVTGLYVRGSPLGMMLNVDLFVGTGTVDNEALSSSVGIEEFPNPSMLLLGGGVSVLGGAIGVVNLRSHLRPSGFFSPTEHRTGVWLINVDLTAAGLALTGALNRGD